MVPAITAVSNPNRRPPRAATTVALIEYLLSFMASFSTIPSVTHNAFDFSWFFMSPECTDLVYMFPFLSHRF